jgi:hypothetical protein
MPLTRNRKTLALAEVLKKSLATRLFGVRDADTNYITTIPHHSGIRGFGYGSKVTENSIGAEVAIRVYVRTKLPKRDLAAADRVPEEIDGVPTDVVAVGDIRASWPRPISCGVSISQFASSAGTLGCLVQDSKGKHFILSNNHILANANAAKVGDDILEPATLDGGTSNPPLARLSDFEALNFTGGKNHIDAAIAEPIDATSVLPDILSIGGITPKAIQPVQHMSVAKRGRTTLHTLGVITDIAADIPVRYGIKIAHFEHQIAITGVSSAFSDDGDSGALVVSAIEKRPVGLLFAGGGSISFCNPIDLVLTRFGVMTV